MLKEHIHRIGLIAALLMLTVMVGCRREPELHLYDEAEVDFDIPEVELALDVYWNYELDYDIAYGVHYDWRAEWFYGWDTNDISVFGIIGYSQPTVFELRRYYTGELPFVPHTTRQVDIIYGTSFSDKYRWGFWDFLVWNQLTPHEAGDNVLNIQFDEETSLDFVRAYTNQTMRATRYQAPKYTRSFYQPEELFAAYDQGEEINENLDGFVYDEVRNKWVKQLNMKLEPLTYIYLTQVILHNNHGKIASVDGEANLSGMAREVVLNTGVTGRDAVTVAYTVLKKDNCDYKPLPSGAIEKVDIIGGRLLTFGMCNANGNRFSRADEVTDSVRHFMDVTVQFNNGMDSTLVFNVTDQVRKRFKGGVITVELDLDTVPIPSRSGGSGFDAVVEDYKEETHEFEM